MLLLFYIYLHILYACNITSLVVLGMRSRKVHVSQCISVLLCWWGKCFSTFADVWYTQGAVCVCQPVCQLQSNVTHSIFIASHSPLIPGSHYFSVLTHLVRYLNENIPQISNALNEANCYTLIIFQIPNSNRKHLHLALLVKNSICFLYDSV